MRPALVVLLALAACVPGADRVDVRRDDAGSLSVELAGWAADAGGRPDAAVENRLVRSAPTRVRDVGLCSADHWCWENPLPQGNDLRAVWAAPGGAAFAVGPGGLALRFDGTTWSRVSTGVADDLSAVWGTSASDVFAAGPGLLLRWDGQGFLRQEPPPGRPEVLFGTGSELWAAGEAIVRWDGKAWSEVQAAGEWRFVDLAGTGPTDLWALARDESPKGRGKGLLFRFDGKAWTRSALPFALGSGRLLPVGAQAAWLATDQGVLARFDGKAWKQEQTLGGAGAVPVLVALPGGGLVAGGVGRPLVRFDGKAWSREPQGLPLRHAAPTAPGVAWGVGDRGLIARFSSGAWLRVAGAGDPDLLAVHGTGFDDLWAVGASGTVLRRSREDVWQIRETPLRSRLTGVWAAGRDDVWVVGDAELAHWDGKAFTSRWEAGFGKLTAIAGRSSSAIWAVGERGILRFDGKTWVATPATKPLRAVTVSSRGDVWALGEGGLLRFDGAKWAEAAGPAEGAHNLLFGGAGGPYVSGAKGVFRFDGRWTSVLSRGETLGGFAAAPDDVWAVGPQEVRVWNGVGWRRTATGTGARLRAVFAKNGEAVAVGDGGAILHYRP